MASDNNRKMFSNCILQRNLSVNNIKYFLGAIENIDFLINENIYLLSILFMNEYFLYLSYARTQASSSLILLTADLLSQ